MDELIGKAIEFSDGEKKINLSAKKKGILIYLICAVFGCIGAMICRYQYLPSVMNGIWIFEALFAALGAYFMFFVKERLPEYYDKNDINVYGDGAFRMNLLGISFNNKNWPYIVEGARTGCVLGMVLTPVIFLLAAWLFPPEWDMYIKFVFVLVALCFIFILIYCTGKKYK